MKDLWYRVLIAWYRLLGATAVQAEWKARRALKRPDEAKSAVAHAAARTADRRFNCVCGQLLVAEDKTCHSCGRRQYLPFGVRRVLRAVGLVMPSALPGTILAGLSLVIGYAIQLQYGDGGVMDPSPGLEGYDLGAAFPDLVLGSQPWRAFTYTMLHGGLMHIAFNAIALMQVGPLVEHEFGAARFGFAWIVGGILAAALPALLGGDRPMVGASGAVFSMIGMALVWGHLVGTAQGRMLRDVMVRWTIYATVFGIVISGPQTGIQVAHGAHFAGLGIGAALGYLLPPPGRDPTRRRLSPLLGAAAIALVVASLIGAGSWMADGRPMPSDASFRLQYHLIKDLGQREGWQATFGDDAVLLDEAREIRKAGHPRAEVRALDRRASEAMAGMTAAESYIFGELLIKRLYPNGRRPIDPHDPQR